MGERVSIPTISEIITPDMRQCLIAVEDAEIFEQRKNDVFWLLKEDTLTSKIVELTLSDSNYRALYEDSDKHTSVEQLWNRHDVFHAVTTLLYGLLTIDVLRKSKTCSEYLDDYFVPTIAVALLWHDAVRGVIKGSAHALLGMNLDDPIRNILTKCVNENMISKKESEHILVRVLRCIVAHNQEDACDNFDMALVRIVEGLDCDEHRSYFSKLYSWRQLLQRRQLTHVLGTAFIKTVEIGESGQADRPVLVTLHLNGRHETWNIYNWFQVQERIKLKTESTGFGKIFRLKIVYEDGVSEFCDFS